MRNNDLVFCLRWTLLLEPRCNALIKFCWRIAVSLDRFSFFKHFRNFSFKLLIFLFIATNFSLKSITYAFSTSNSLKLDVICSTILFTSELSILVDTDESSKSIDSSMLRKPVCKFFCWWSQVDGKTSNVWLIILRQAGQKRFAISLLKQKLFRWNLLYNFVIF